MTSSDQHGRADNYRRCISVSCCVIPSLQAQRPDFLVVRLLKTAGCLGGTVSPQGRSRSAVPGPYFTSLKT